MTNTMAIIISSILCAVTITYTIKTILNIKCQLNDWKTIILMLLFALIIYLSFGIKYNTESMFFKIALCIIAFKTIFNYSTYKTIISVLITVALLSVGDLISNMIFINFVTIEEMRGLWYWILICNISVCAITLLFIRIPFIKNKLKSFIANLDDKGKISTIFLFILSVIVIAYTFYNISLNYNWSEKYYINVIIAITYFIIIIIFLKDKSDYNSLMQQYDSLFDYFKEFEESIDEVSLINHEYKNQLAVIKGYIENNKKKEALKYLSDVIQDVETEDKMVVSELKCVPKGGIKGLLYYKIISAKNKNVTVVLDISNNITKYLQNLTYDENKLLSKALGVYVDNAIDAASLVRKKIITIEMYVLGDQLNIVVSNPFKKNKVKFSKISKKGYTTKGKGHGKGLYLINKMINRIDWFSSETKIINNYYVQRIIIDTKKIH